MADEFTTQLLAKRDELRDEQQHLRSEWMQLARQRQQVKRKLEAIAELLGDKANERAPEPGDDEIVTGGEGEEAGIPLDRNLVEAAVREIGHAKPAQVTERLKAGGVADNSKTSLAIRVSNLMRKMLMEGLLTRDDEGSYFVPD